MQLRTAHTRRARTHSRALPLTLMLLALLPLAANAQDTRTRRTTDDRNSSSAPTVVVTPDINVITLCPEDAARARTEVRLTSDTTGFSSPGSVRYTWTTNGGTIREEGTTAVWDLSGVAPGAYTASLEVDDGVNALCRAFTSATIVARPCPPIRIQCPVVTINCPDTVEAGQPVNLSANISGARADLSPGFNWTVTGGTIVAGQGTSAITVDTTGFSGTYTANVQVTGFDQTCPATASCTVSVPALPLPRKFDEFPSISFDDDKARLDNLAVELQNDPTARGFIVVYPGRRARPDQASRLGERARRYLTQTRGIDASRLIVVSGAPRERATYELYIVPVGATPPAVGQ